MIAFVFASSVLLSLLFFGLWRKSHKFPLLYTHLFFLLFPFLFTSFQIQCSMGLISALSDFCSMAWTKVAFLFAPVAIVFAFILGYVFLSRFYTAFLPVVKIKKHKIHLFARKLKIPKPSLYLLDSVKPLAFTLFNSVFISVGMFELLSKKEQEAVLLHELGHIKNRSSVKKFSLKFFSCVSPVTYFFNSNSVLASEEKRADCFAVKTQGTNRYLVSTKKKLREYYSCKFK